MLYTIEYLEEVVTQQIPHIPEPFKTAIKRAIEERISVDPITFGKPLRYSLHGHRRLRVGDYRIVYRVKPEEHAILIVAIKHRKDVYE